MGLSREINEKTQPIYWEYQIKACLFLNVFNEKNAVNISFTL